MTDYEKNMLFEKLARAQRVLAVKAKKSEWLNAEEYGYFTGIGDIINTFGLTEEYNKWKEGMEND